MGKTNGILAARKLRNVRRVNRWADAQYNKAHLGVWLKANPLEGACMAKGIVTGKVGVSAKQPNSAVRKAVRVQLTKNGKRVTAFVPWDGSINYIDGTDEVVISGFGRSGRTKGDIPGCRFKVIKVAGIGLYALFRGKREKRGH